MPCRPIHDENGKMVGIACSRGRRAQKCHQCGRDSTRLCDWPVAEGKTCDRPLCALHAWRVGPDRDYCEEHKQQDAMRF